MKLPIVLLLASLLLFTGCEVLHRPGIIVREPVSKIGKYGAYERMEDVISINADVPGLTEIPTKRGPIRIAQVSGQNTKLILNKQGALVGTETSTIFGGLSVTDHVTARGAADRFRIKESSAGVTGAALSLIAPAAIAGPAVGPAVSAIK